MTVPILWLSILAVTSECTTKCKTRVYSLPILESLRLDPPSCSALFPFSFDDRFSSAIAFSRECSEALGILYCRSAPRKSLLQNGIPSSPWVFEGGLRLHFNMFWCWWKIVVEVCKPACLTLRIWHRSCISTAYRCSSPPGEGC